MTQNNFSWRNASPGDKTAIFAIGDIHSHYDLLGPLLADIKKKINDLPPDVTAHVVFIGDYIDRGTGAPETIDMLLKFKKEMEVVPQAIPQSPSIPLGWLKKNLFGIEPPPLPPAKKSKVVVTHLCGNHDEVFKRTLETKKVVSEVWGDTNNPMDHQHCKTKLIWDEATQKEVPAMTLKGLELSFESGGVIETVHHYIPEIDTLSLYDREKKCFVGEDDSVKCKKAEELLKILQQKVPEKHKQFFNDVYNKDYHIVGDYLLTHAGIDPSKSLPEQGIDNKHASPDAPHNKGEKYLDFLMMRNHFLWDNDEALSKSGRVIVHGHTPSAIKYENDTVADGQKNYRLCVDTDVCKPDGALTCFSRYQNLEKGINDNGFIAVSKNNPGKVHEYDIPEVSQAYEAWVHKIKYPQYHKDAQVRI